MTNLPVRSMLRMALIIFGVAVAYFVTGRFLFVLGAPPNGAVTTVWLPSGISVATLVLFGPFAAIGSFLGSVTLELKNGVPLPAGFLVGLANAGSELLCYALIVRGGRTLSIVARRDVLRFVMAALISSLLSAVVGVSAYVLFDVVPATIFWPTWLTWFGSAAIGIVLITPFLVYSVCERPALGSPARYLEYAAALVALASAAFLWQDPAFTNHTDDPVILAVILVLLWIAFRFPPAAMTLAVFSFAIASVGGAVFHFSHAPPESAFAAIFVLQLMLGGLAVIGYLLDSMVADLKCAAAALQEDISKLTKGEEEVRRQQELTAQIIATIPVRVFWKDRDSRFLGCNTLFANDAGLSRPDELIGKTDFDMGWKEQAELYRADDQRVMVATTPRLLYDEPQTTPEGKLIWLRTSKVALRDAAHQVIGILGIYEDITSSKEMELRLLESEERFRTAFQNSAIGMALVGLDGRWIKVNNSLCQIVGYAEEELLGKTFQDITHPDDLQADLGFVTRLLAGKIDHYQMEKRYLHKDGQTIWIRLSVSLIRSAQGHPIHFVSQMEDVSERKQGEEKIRKLNAELETRVQERTQQLQEAQEELVRKEKLAILGQLSGSVGHELRNPLGVMSNAVYFLKMVLTGADATTKEYLDIIKKEIDNSLRIITDLLDFARTRTPQKSAVAPGEILRQSLKKCVLPDNVAVTVTVPDGLPAVNVDLLQMEQVLINFLTNAVQAMPAGGALRVVARLVGAGLVPAHEQQGQPQGFPLQDCVAIAVTDSGEGITPENMKKLFQPLFTTKAKGIGLGLVVCKNLVEANGGRIEVESTPGQGTTFTVLLPVEIQ